MAEMKFPAAQLQTISFAQPTLAQCLGYGVEWNLRRHRTGMRSSTRTQSLLITPTSIATPEQDTNELSVQCAKPTQNQSPSPRTEPPRTGSGFCQLWGCSEYRSTPSRTRVNIILAYACLFIFGIFDGKYSTENPGGLAPSTCQPTPLSNPGDLTSKAGRALQVGYGQLQTTSWSGVTRE
eukprot:2683912-Rhodomonas_salina.1